MKLTWERIEGTQSIDGKTSDAPGGWRTKVPGGWFVCITLRDGGGLTFYHDPEHEWDGNSLP
jgi:hypothetical protein